jgi:hypothetical protein
MDVISFYYRNMFKIEYYFMSKEDKKKCDKALERFLRDEAWLNEFLNS